jgi:sugar fermentation stimulation protein A
MLYIIQRSDVQLFAPAKEIDPVYADLLKQAHRAGVEIFPMQAKVTPSEITWSKKLPFEL